jgi:hypothetical protein
MTLETMKELFGIAHIRDDEEELPTRSACALGKRRSQSRRASAASRQRKRTF